MTCILIPTDGPVRVHSVHPSKAVVSDMLGGAIPVGIVGPNGLMFSVRETMASEGLDRNHVASVAASLTIHGPVPLSGPVLITYAGIVGLDGTGEPLLGETLCLPEEWTEPLRVVLENIRAAIEDRPQDIDGPDDVPLWAENVKAMSRKLAALVYPDGYPAGRRFADDPVAETFRRLGIFVRPEAGASA